MAKAAAKLKDLQVNHSPLTPERWPDFEKLFGPRGACGGCWCMFWRRARKEFEAGKGEGHRRAMKALVDGGTVPGILAYAGGEPIGWCSVSPRESFPALANSRIFQPVDDKPVWSVTCLFVHRKFRKKGVSVGLLRAAAAHVKRSGGRMVEGYAVEAKSDKPIPAAFAWNGTAAAYEKAGFKEVLRRSETRPIMRLAVR
jgi:GNAT superfamily N-acetyltransferase